MTMENKLFLNHIICATFAGFVLFGYNANSFAWGSDGHTAIGILAVNQVQTDALHKLETLLSPLNKQAMEITCNWPDAILDTGEGTWSAPLHYINIPRDEEVYLGPRDCPKQAGHLAHPERPAQYCVTDAIKHFAASLGNHEISNVQRGQAFAWLCHLVADLHQPLHAGFSDDRGGNDFNIVYGGEKMNLHGFWDFTLIDQHAGSWQYLVGLLSPFPPVRAESNWSPEMVNDWTNRSHNLAKEKVYPTTRNIDENYEQQSWELVQQQLRLAASHLALIINTELKDGD